MFCWLRVFLVTSNTCLCSCDSYLSKRLSFYFIKEKEWNWTWGPNTDKTVFSVCLRLTWHRTLTRSYSSSDTKVVLHCETDPPRPRFISAGFIIFLGICMRLAVALGLHCVLSALSVQWVCFYNLLPAKSFHFPVILRSAYLRHFAKGLKQRKISDLFHRSSFQICTK